MAHWQVNQARNHLSDVLDQADSHGPQIITHHGQERAVVLSIKTYRSLNLSVEPVDFISYLLSIPKINITDEDIERDHSIDERETGL